MTDIVPYLQIKDVSNHVTHLGPENQVANTISLMRSTVTALCKIILQLPIVTNKMYAILGGLKSGGLLSCGLISGGLKPAPRSKHEYYMANKVLFRSVPFDFNLSWKPLQLK